MPPSARLGAATECRRSGPAPSGLVERQQHERVDPSTTVRNDDLGELTVAGWLAYLTQHPEQESRGRLRG